MTTMPCWTGCTYEGEAFIEDLSYFEFQNRLAPIVAFLKSIGAWFLPHPWINLFLPSSVVDGYVSGLLEELTPDPTTPILL